MSSKSNTDKFIISLLRSVVNNTTPADFSDDIDWDYFIKIASDHHISNILWYAVDKLNIRPPAQVCDFLYQEHAKALLRDATQQGEAELIINKLSANNIRCLPLKGYNAKKYYPSSDMRYMSDIDLLIDLENAEKTRTVLESLGYMFAFCGKVHDNYIKKPVMHIEVHKYMMDDDMYSIAEYYNSSDAFARGESMSDKFLEYKLTDEEFYIYMIAHCAKHYLTFGTGIISILDIYLFLKQVGDRLNNKHIETELKKIGLLKLNEKLVALANMWFGYGKESKTLEEIGNYIITSGSYGKIENDVINKFLDKSNPKSSLFLRKVKYFFFMIFPSVQYMSGKYPNVSDKPILLPFYWVKRWVSSILFNRESIRLRLFSVLKTKKNVTQLHSQVRDDR